MFCFFDRQDNKNMHIPLSAQTRTKRSLSFFLSEEEFERGEGVGERNASLRHLPQFNRVFLIH